MDGFAWFCRFLSLRRIFSVHWTLGATYEKKLSIVQYGEEWLLGIVGIVFLEDPQ